MRSLFTRNPLKMIYSEGSFKSDAAVYAVSPVGSAKVLFKAPQNNERAVKRAREKGLGLGVGSWNIERKRDDTYTTLALGR